MTRQRFILVLEDLPPRLREGMATPAPVAVRLRMALKALVRHYGLRCLDAQEARQGHADGAGGVGAK